MSIRLRGDRGGRGLRGGLKVRLCRWMRREDGSRLALWTFQVATPHRTGNKLGMQPGAVRACHESTLQLCCTTMLTLGLSNMRDAAAALVENGRVIAAAEEERFVRSKH